MDLLVLLCASIEPGSCSTNCCPREHPLESPINLSHSALNLSLGNWPGAGIFNVTNAVFVLIKRQRVEVVICPRDLRLSERSVNNPFCCFEGSHQVWVLQVHAVSTVCE